MKLAFVDLGGWDYDADTPYQSPLGGSQSAAVYLAAELARLGVEVAYVNGVKASRRTREVQFLPSGEATAGFFAAFDVVVVVGSADARAMRRDLGVRGPMVLWTGHAHDQPAVQHLRNAAEQEAWTALAVVSEWQRERFRDHLGVMATPMVVKRNAAAPAFLERALPEPWFVTGAEPVLAYTSTPFRGLDVLLAAFPAIHEQVPGTRLKVFSSLEVYRVAPQADPFAGLYQLCRSLPGVEYVGAIAQSDLARELECASALAYPSTFAETSCISVMEAMAAGAMILTTALGALPETTHGFAQLLPVTKDGADLTRAYAGMVVRALLQARERPRETAEHLARQSRFAREHYDWKARAREWLAWLDELRC